MSDLMNNISQMMNNGQMPENVKNILSSMTNANNENFVNNSNNNCNNNIGNSSSNSYENSSNNNSINNNENNSNSNKKNTSHNSNNNRFYIVHNGVIENYLKLKQWVLEVRL